jgi:hypothetical protein
MPIIKKICHQYHIWWAYYHLRAAEKLAELYDCTLDGRDLQASMKHCERGLKHHLFESRYNQ